MSISLILERHFAYSFMQKTHSHALFVVCQPVFALINKKASKKSRPFIAAT